MKIILLPILLLFVSAAYAKVCPKETYLVQGHPRQGYYRSNGTHVSAANVTSYCRNYRDEGPLKQQFLMRTPKGWPHNKEKFKKCSIIKQLKISKILAAIPKILTNVGKLKIYCATKSETPNNPATNAPYAKIITLYNSSFKMDTKRVIVHELAHILYARLSNKEKKSYNIASQWKYDPLNNIYITKRTNFSAKDGSNDPEEDFANNIEYYLLENNKFKTQFIKINSWIENFIGDFK